MTAEAWAVVFFTLRTALLSTLLILPFGIAVAWLLARRDWFGRAAVETIVMLPLFVPPVATGLLLLKIFGRRSALGSILERDLGIDIIFTPRAVVIACAVMSFPLLVRTAQTAFADVNRRLEQIARTLGAGEGRVFRTITLPLAARGIASGAVLAFARAMGEFGATAIVAGMIPGRTMTISLAIYHNIELGRDEAAWPLVAISTVIVFLAVFLAQMLTRRRRAR